MQPLSYQSDCLAALVECRRKHRQKALVVMATGLGKTVVSAFDVQRLLTEAPGRVLYLCHQNDILRQARETFEEILGDSYSYGYFHGTEKHLHKVDVLFASFQTMATWRDAFHRDEFRYVVVDEVHHAHAATFRPTVEYFTPEFLVGLTATPERADGLDITELFGKPVYELGLFKALAQDHLCEVDYRVMTDEIQNAGVLDTPAGKLSIAELNRTIFIPKRDEEIVRIIGEKVKEVQNPRVIVFCNSIAHAERMAALMPHAAVVHSKLKHDEKRRRLDAFRRGDVDTVLTVDMLNEGIDIPQANVIVFLRSTGSKTVFLQQLGRGLRKALGKLKVLVLDFVANCERIEMIDELVQGTKQALGDPSLTTTDRGDGEDGDEVPTQRSTLTLTLDGMAFDERVLKLFDVIRDVRGGYTKEILTQQLLDKARELGRTPTHNEVARDQRMASIRQYTTTFNTTSWNKILRQVGLALTSEWGIAAEELIQQIAHKATLLGRSPTRKEVNDDPNMASSITFSRTLTPGSNRWDDVLIVAGQQPIGMPKSTREYTQDELHEQLLRKIDELGHAPSLQEVSRDTNMADPATFEKVYGMKWREILRSLGYEPNSARYTYTLDDLKAMLLAMAQRLGSTPSVNDLKKDSAIPSLPVFLRAFGVKRWNEVILIVGLTPNRPERSHQ